MTDFNITFDDDALRRIGGHRPASRWPSPALSPPRVQNSIVEERRLPDTPADILWLRVSFSTAFDAHGVADWHRRLSTFLSSCGLVGAISVERVAIFAVGQSITSFDRGLLIGWLTAQPEVVFAQVDRRPTRVGWVPTNKAERRG